VEKAVDNYWGCGNPVVKRSKRGDCGQNVESYPQKKTGLSTEKDGVIHRTSG
jgi:hypothetical protein